MECEICAHHRHCLSRVIIWCAAVAACFSPLVGLSQTATPAPGISSNTQFSVPEDLGSKSFVTGWGTASGMGRSNVIGELRACRYTLYVILIFCILNFAVNLAAAAFRNIQP